MTRRSSAWTAPQEGEDDGMELMNLPFALRWESVGNPTTQVQSNAKNIALEGPTTDSVAYRAWYDSLGDLSTEPDMEVASPPPFFNRTVSSLKLRDEYKPNVSNRKARRASVTELGSPFRRSSMLKRMSAGVPASYVCELPKWVPLKPGSTVQVLDRPDWVQRVRNGLEARHGRCQSAPDLGQTIRPASMNSESFERTTLEGEELELQKQRRIKKIEKIRQIDTERGEFEDMKMTMVRKEAPVPDPLGVLPPEISEQHALLKDFQAKTEERGRRTFGTLRRKTKKQYQPTEEEWAVIEQFWDWCKNTFGDLAKAFREIDFNNSGSVSSVEFADGLRSKGYPGNETTYKNIFFLFDADQDGAIGKKEFMGSKLKRPQAPEEMPEIPEDERRPSKTYDPFDKMNLTKRKSSILDTKRESMVKGLWAKEPVVSQFVQHLYISYKSLRAAFREIDLNRNGLLSKSEFKDGLRILKVGTKSMLEMHVDDLFDRLDADLSGSISLDEMVAETADPLVKRLVHHLTVVRKDFHSRHEDSKDTKADVETLRFLRLERVFSKLDDDESKQIDRVEFHAAMKKMRYIDWHASDLFDRLDKDRSGQLDAGEFTAFLEQDPSKKKEASKDRTSSKTGNAVDQTDELQDEAHKSFQAKFETGAYGLMFNTKLQHIGCRSNHTMDKLRLGLQAGDSEAKAGGWTTDTSGVQVCNREDYIAKVREQLVLHKNSKLRSTGEMKFGVAHHHQSDHLPLCMGMSTIARHPVHRPVARPQTSIH